MNIQVKEPDTAMLLHMTATPEKLEGIHGFRIQHGNTLGFFITPHYGSWEVLDGHHLDTDLITNVGMALEGVSLDEQITHIY